MRAEFTLDELKKGVLNPFYDKSIKEVVRDVICEGCK